MKKQILIALGVTGVLILVLGSIKGCQIADAIQKGKSRKQPPTAITTFVAEAQSWPVEFQSVGSVVPVQGAVLSAEEMGRVSSVSFESGAAVKAGQVLVELDASVEEAQLKGAEAQLKLAKIEAKRQRALRERNANAKSDLDKAESSLQNAIAEVERLQAQIERKQIVAPFDGRAGIRKVNIGETISAGTPVVSVQSYNPLYVNFSLPQKVLSEIEEGVAVKVATETFPDIEFEGTLSTIESRVNPDTRNIDLQATIKNKDHKLKPGMFADVTVLLSKEQNVIAIPSSSINFAPYGDSVYVLEPASEGDGKIVRQQIVKIGRRRGDLVAIVSGLKPGEEIASSGTFKLRPGAEVVVNNKATPGADPSPTPTDT